MFSTANIHIGYASYFLHTHSILKEMTTVISNYNYVTYWTSCSKSK